MVNISLSKEELIALKFLCGATIESKDALHCLVLNHENRFIVQHHIEKSIILKVNEALGAYL